MKTRREVAEDKRQRRIKVFGSLFIVFLLVFSTVGYYFSGDGTSTNYNGFKIKPVLDGSGAINGYVLKVDKTTIPFYTHPRDTLSIALPLGFIDVLKQSQGFIFLFDPEDNQSAYYDSVRFDFGSAISTKPQGVAITQPANASSPHQFQVLSCADASAQTPIILFRHGTRSLIFEEGCFVMQGELQDILLLRDRVLYAYYGVSP